MRSALMLAAALAAGCARPASLPVVLDLAAAAPAADRDGAWQVTRFGTPSGVSAQLAGFFDAPLVPGDDTSAWLARSSEVGLRLATVEPRAALFDLEPFPGLDSQRVEVFLNDARIGGFGVSGPRRRYRLLLPVAAQREGMNRLRLVCRVVGESQKGYRRRMAAVLYSVTVAPAGDGALADLLSAKAPPPFTAAGGDVGLAAPGVVRYAFVAPGDAELRFAASLHPVAHAAGGRASLRVTIEEEGRPERTLWSGSATARASLGEVRVPLGVAPGARVVLALRHEGAPGARFAWPVFGQPRVLGRPVEDALRGLPEPPAPDPRADSLRRSLAGANVVYVILDAAGARRFGTYGSTRATTPEIDRIARDGVVFEDAYSVATFTHLSMGSAWTSALPDEHHNGVLPNAPLPRDRPTLAEILARNGVHTAGFVSNGVAGPGFALDRGFAEFDEVYKRLGSYAPAYRQVLPAWLAGRAGAGRFFLYVHFREPHFAYDPPPPYNTMFGPDAPLTREQRTKYDWITDLNWKRKIPTAAELDHLGRLYDGNLASVDHEVGELRRQLESAGLWDRSLVIITSDHGDGLYEHEYVGHLDQVYEEQTRVPLVLKFPKGGPAGQRVRGLVDTLDVAPTIADAFQLLGRDAATRGFRGQSLLPVALGAPTRPYSLARCAGEQPKYGLRIGGAKLVYHTARDSAELYDLAADPGERRDLAASRPVDTAYFRQSVRRLILELRRGPRASGDPGAELTPEQRENLKALGYLP